MEWLARRHPVAVVLAGAVIALLAALGAAAAWSATHDDGQPTPEVSLHLTGKDRDELQNPLVSGDPKGQPVPTTRFERLGVGGLTSLAAHRGHPLVVNFFASTCIPCVKEMPALERVHRSLGGRVDFVGLAVRDGAREALDLVKRTGVTYETGRDPAGDIAADLGVVNMPSTFLVSASGTVVVAHPGAVTESTLRRLIDDNLL